MFDIHGVMADLSKHRPLFHSEADFQDALAWEIQKTMPDCEIGSLRKKEIPDLCIPSERIAIELRHCTEKLELERGGKSYFFKSHGARDRGRHGFLFDIERLERVVKGGEAKSGVVVLLTNDSLYWDQTRSQKSNPTDADFHIYEGRRVTGYLALSDDTAESTKKELPPIYLTDSYRMRWRDYSNLGEGKHQQFRYLAVSVGRGSG